MTTARGSPRDDIRDLVAYLKTLHGFDPSKPRGLGSTGGVTYERIRGAAAEPQNWLTYWGDYSGRHFSSLTQINRRMWPSFRLSGPCRCPATVLCNRCQSSWTE